MNYYLLAFALVSLIFIIVIAKLIFKIHELYVKVKNLNEYCNEVLNIVKDHTIVTKEIIGHIDVHMTNQYDQLNAMHQYIRNELTDELNAIGRTTTEQADIMLNIEKKINELELERPDEKEEKEGDAIESERISAACAED